MREDSFRRQPAIKNSSRCASKAWKSACKGLAKEKVKQGSHLASSKVLLKRLFKSRSGNPVEEQVVVGLGILLEISSCSTVGSSEQRRQITIVKI